MTGHRILASDMHLVLGLGDCRVQRVYHLVALDEPIIEIEQDGDNLIRHGHRDRIGKSRGSAVVSPSIGFVEPDPEREERDFVPCQTTNFSPHFVHQLLCAHD